MKLLFNFFPVIVFFLVYKWNDDLILATAMLIPATLLQIAYTWITRKIVEKMQLVTLLLIIILGGATIIMDNSKFIMWKPTVVNGLFCIAFLGSHFIGDKPIVQRMMEGNIKLPLAVWRWLNLAWVSFFGLSGVINLYVAFNFSENFWVNFKLFGMLGLTLIFVILQAVYITRYTQLKAEKQ